MSRKGKIDPVEKVRIVERYLKGEIGIRDYIDYYNNRRIQRKLHIMTRWHTTISIC